MALQCPQVQIPSFRFRVPRDLALHTVFLVLFPIIHCYSPFNVAVLGRLVIASHFQKVLSFLILSLYLHSYLVSLLKGISFSLPNHLLLIGGRESYLLPNIPKEIEKCSPIIPPFDIWTQLIPSFISMYLKNILKNIHWEAVSIMTTTHLFLLA